MNQDSISFARGQSALSQSNGNGHADNSQDNGRQTLLWFVYHAEERDALRAHGLDATARENADVDGRHVAIVTGAGDFHAIGCAPTDAQSCYGAGALSVRVVCTPTARGATTADLLASGVMTISGLEALAEAADPIIDEHIEPWPELCLEEPPAAVPFPVEVFPVALQRFCRGVAEVTLTPADMAGCAMLATASAAIGQSIRIHLKKTYRETALLYLLIVAPPGSTKSPTLRLVFNPLTKIDIRLRKESKDARTLWEAQKKSLPKGETAPEEPPQRRAIVKDITRETLAAILQDNPRGVLANPDEATAWVSSFNEYKARGSDRQFWLDIWGSGPISVDRDQGRRALFVKSPGVTVCGGLVPDMTGSLSEEHGRHDGFIDRILFAYPDAFPDQFWTEDELDDGDKSAWEHVIKDLYDVPMDCTEEGELGPHVISMEQEAKAAWITWHDNHVREMASDDMPAKSQGIWSKYRAYSARFILILSRLRLAMDPEADLKKGPANLADVQGAIRLTEYFKTHCLRINCELTGGTGSPEALAVLRWIKRKHCDEFRVADIRPDLRRRFPTLASLQTPIRLLVDAGAIRLRKESTDEPVKPGPKPTATYEVNPKVLAGS